jgi:S-methylmethionine-dependent homocysteine/selenocysteine methylase
VTSTNAAVPELTGQLMLTDTGVETDLIFNQGVDLPLFACFVLGDDAAGRDRLVRWHRGHAQAALDQGLGVSLDAVTWRASSDWGDRLGYDAQALDRVNQDLVRLLQDMRSELTAGQSSAGDGPVMRVGGTVGPRSDGYQAALLMSADEAEAYHLPQLRSFVEAGADRASALTLGYVAEAVGITRAAAQLDLPMVIGFTLETDGRLPDGTTLSDAVDAVDGMTDASAAGFLVNCAHPDHVAPALDEGGEWLRRLIGIRPNASRLSHAELDEATELDDGDPDELARQVADLRRQVPTVNLVGGCCGTDVRHARAIAAAVAAS